MAKKAFEEVDEVQELKKENRQLRNTVRALQKALKKLSKGKDRLEDLEEMFKDLSLEETEAGKTASSAELDRCPSCNKGKLKTTSLGAKTLETCTNCRHRKLL